MTQQLSLFLRNTSPTDAKGKELLHTTSEHPFLTKEKSFTPAGQLPVGMHVRKADGTWGVVETVKIVNDVQVMYNLEVAQDHTFVVGDGEWVVHNVCGPSNYLAKLTDAARGNGPPRIILTRTGPRFPMNTAAVALTYQTNDGGVTLFNSARSSKALGHSEAQLANWAENQLPDLINTYGPGGKTEFSLVTQYAPCPTLCGPAIRGNIWSNRLSSITGSTVDFNVWHYNDRGAIKPWP